MRGVLQTELGELVVAGGVEPLVTEPHGSTRGRRDTQVELEVHLTTQSDLLRLALLSDRDGQVERVALGITEGSGHHDLSLHADGVDVESDASVISTLGRFGRTALADVVGGPEGDAADRGDDGDDELVSEGHESSLSGWSLAGMEWMGSGTNTI